jgi:hypothetical protein
MPCSPYAEVVSGNYSHGVWTYQTGTLPKGSQNSSALLSAASKRQLYLAIAHSLLLLLCDRLLAPSLNPSLLEREGRQRALRASFLESNVTNITSSFRKTWRNHCCYSKGCRRTGRRFVVIYSFIRTQSVGILYSKGSIFFFFLSIEFFQMDEEKQ